MSDSIGTTLLRRHIGRWLVKLRVRAGYTQEAAAEALQRGSATIWRMEAGDSRIRFRDVDVNAMCDLYGVEPATRQRLLALTADTRAARKAWWHDYTDSALPPWFGLYVSLEDAAATIRQYESESMPGLLQTQAYAEAVTRHPRGQIDEEEVGKRVGLRLERQALLNGARPPRLRFILNEAVLHRMVGGRQVMAEQLRHLMDTIDRHGVSVRVLPFECGAHGGMNSSFSLLSFPTAPLADEPTEPPLAYVDTLTGALYLSKSAEVRAYELAWDDLETQALDEPSSRKLITTILEALTRD
nr:helix-turn-helix transcriptional regulator [Micromonospora sp. DSM 115978]